MPQTHLPQTHIPGGNEQQDGAGSQDTNSQALPPAASTAQTRARALGLGPREEGHHIGAITWVTPISAGARRAHRQAGFSGR